MQLPGWPTGDNLSLHFRQFTIPRDSRKSILLLKNITKQNLLLILIPVCNIRIKSQDHDRIIAGIYSINGALMAAEQSAILMPGTNAIELDFESFSPGVYIVRIVHKSGGQKFLKVMKQ